MRKIHMKGIAAFKAGKKKSHAFYCALKQAALDYKYRDFKGMPVAVTPRELFNDPVFSFKESDKIIFRNGSSVNGKRLRELYVTSVFACLLDEKETFDDFKIKGKTIRIAYPLIDEGDDTFITVSNGEFGFLEKGKFALGIAGKSSLFYRIQTKEYFNFKDSLKDIQSPRAFRLSNLSPKRLLSYTDIILVYIRSFTEIIFADLYKELEAAALKDKRIILIGMTAGENIPTVYTFWDLKKSEEYTAAIPICNFFHTFEELTGLKPIDPRL
jgi:hypothetical protein